MLTVVGYTEICYLELSNHQSCTLDVVNSLLVYIAIAFTRSLNEVAGQCCFQIFFINYILMVNGSVSKSHAYSHLLA